MRERRTHKVRPLSVVSCQIYEKGKKKKQNPTLNSHQFAVELTAAFREAIQNQMPGATQFVAKEKLRSPGVNQQRHLAAEKTSSSAAHLVDCTGRDRR